MTATTIGIYLRPDGKKEVSMRFKMPAVGDTLNTITYSIGGLARIETARLTKMVSVDANFDVIEHGGNSSSLKPNQIKFTKDTADFNEEVFEGVIIGV